MAAKPMVGERSPLDAHASWLVQVIAEEPDLTLEELRGQLGEHGISASTSSLWR